MPADMQRSGQIFRACPAITCYPIALRQGISLEGRHFISAGCPAGSWDPPIFFEAGVTAAHSHAWLLVKMPGIRLRSLSLQSKSISHAKSSPQPRDLLSLILFYFF